MIVVAHNALLQIVFALTLALPGMTPLLQGASLEAIEQSFSSSMNERGQTIQELKVLEEKHQRLTARITKLKQTKSSGLTTRLALEELLRESQELTAELESLQNRIHGIDSKILGQRTQMMSGIDRKMRSLETSLASVDAGKRRSVVKELNALRSRRSSLAVPLPAVPSIRAVESALVFGDGSDDPDTLVAAADELEDTEDQLQRRVAAIDDRLAELRHTQRLMRRAQSFAREERFFEEDNRERVIAKYSKVTVTQTDTNKAGGDVASADNTDSSNEGALESDYGNNGSPEFMPSAGHDDSDIQRSPAPDSNSGQVDPVTVDPDPVFDTASKQIVINSADNPETAIGATDSRRNSGGLSGQIQGLESEKRALEKKAKALKKRARELRSKANSL